MSHRKRFLLDSGGGFAILKTLEKNKKKQFIVEILCNEGQKSSEIEGEILERESLQSSIRRHFGLKAKGTISSTEQGMADLLWDLYQTYNKSLTHKMLYRWHKMLTGNDQRVSDIGKYRTHPDPMQIISGRYDQHRVFFEAPPSKKVHEEMTRFINWFNKSDDSQSVLVRAAIVHVYFESIHPFEDGNGRIGRALVEKALSQSLGQPIFIAISEGISKRKKKYYDALASTNRTLDIQKWLEYFAEVIIQAQEKSIALIQFLMAKSQLMKRLESHLNLRQKKILLRMFNEGLTGFSGGLSAENYIKITKASRATATRDLKDLINKGALYKTGDLKHTRYWINLKI